MSLHAVPAPPPSPREQSRPLWRDLVGAVLRQRRLRAGLRLRDVAERAGISTQYLSEVERGRKEPSSEMLESICGALEADLLDLVQAVGRRLQAAGGTVPGTAQVSLDLAASRPAVGGALSRPSHAIVRMAA